MMMAELRWWVRRGGRWPLALPVDMPRLDIDHAIARGWRPRPGSRLLEPDPRAERFLTTYSLGWRLEAVPGRWWGEDHGRWSSL